MVNLYGRMFGVPNYVEKKRQQEVINTYHALMSDLCVRNTALNSLLENRGGLPPSIVRECAYLQLRMMVELVALGCVVAHDDVTQSRLKELRKTYHAAQILDRLEGYDTSFFPQAVLRERVGDGYHLTRVIGTLEKPELKKMWEACGRYLHRGSVNQLPAIQPVQKGYEDVRHHQVRLIELLKEHTIVVARNSQAILCRLPQSPYENISVAFASVDG